MKKRVRLILIGKNQNLTTFCRISIFFIMCLQIFLCQELAGLKQARLNAYKSVLVCLFVFSFQAIKRFFEKWIVVKRSEIDRCPLKKPKFLAITNAKKVFFKVLYFQQQSMYSKQLFKMSNFIESSITRSSESSDIVLGIVWFLLLFVYCFLSQSSKAL